MNEHYAPLADVHVRRAISYAIDRAAMTKPLSQGFGEPATSLLAPTVPFFDPHAGGLQFDLPKAKAELARSQYPNGFPLEMIVAPTSQGQTTEGEELQQMLKEIDIDLTLKQVELGSEYQLRQQEQYQLATLGWTMDIPDPDEFVSYAFDPKSGSDSLFTGYHNPTVVQLTRQAQRERSQARRRSLYAKLQRIVARDAFVVFVGTGPGVYAHSTKVHGFHATPLGNYHLEDVWLG
jgi:peptide/nickel transport system substrate-binding protein